MELMSSEFFQIIQSNYFAYGHRIKRKTNCFRYPLMELKRIRPLRSPLLDHGNGMPQNTIYALAQTNDGYLWIGSEGGLARFDGFSFTIFSTGANTLAIMKNSVTSLCSDRDGPL